VFPRRTIWFFSWVISFMPAWRALSSLVALAICTVSSLARLRTFPISDMAASVMESQEMPLEMLRAYWSPEAMSPFMWRICWAVTGSSPGALTLMPVEACCSSSSVRFRITWRLLRTRFAVVFWVTRMMSLPLFLPH
jgi:hypothetical protein